MAKALERASDLYDQDFLIWLEQQVEVLRGARTEQLDLPHLIEELEAMVARERRELKNRLEVLLMHLLKWDHQPRRRSRSWRSTMIEQRARIGDLLDDSPSLRQDLEAVAAAAYPVAAERAAAETGLPRSTFPPELPYDLSRVMAGEEGS